MFGIHPSQTVKINPCQPIILSGLKAVQLFIHVQSVFAQTYWASAGGGEGGRMYCDGLFAAFF